MKNFVSTLVITVALIAVVSFCDISPPTEQNGNGYGMDRRGDSDLIIPGDGELPANSHIEPDTTQELSQDELTEESFLKFIHTSTKSVSEFYHQTETEMVLKEKNEVSEMVIAFWHGVAAVLIGEISALMVAFIWMKIRRTID